jgi:hypothetical protein
MNLFVERACMRALFSYYKKRGGGGGGKGVGKDKDKEVGMEMGLDR